MLTKDITYPARDRIGAFGPYDEWKFTTNQMKAAFISGAKLNAADRQIGENNYPHDYHSNQELPNGCGTETQEFPILMDNTVYDGGDVVRVSGRVVYELKDGRTEIAVKFCGVIRHRPGGGFLPCPENSA